MATGADLVQAALGFLGERYSTAPGRTSPTSGHKDCSGLIAAAYQVATGEELGAYVSVTIFDLGVRHDLEIHRDRALEIPGACLLMPENPYVGWGPLGHIGFSTGDGFTVEATPAYRGGVQRLPWTFQRWGTRACLLPGIYYGPPIPEQRAWSDDMIYYGQELDAPGVTVGFAMQGPIIVATFNEPATSNDYGIPDDALRYSNGAIPIRVAHPLVLAKLRRADAVATRA